MTALMIYLSALSLGFLIVVVVSLGYAITASEDKDQNGVTLQEHRDSATP